ncbi:MAG: Smr/MutS family protein, partial [Rhodospirillaceae bacterium]|nr:Smr/MutS family protein [Rhodospirillaceae bacterium]
FLERAFMAGKKTVLVVTGKGLRADGRIGVLRQAVPQWLNTVPIRQWVHAFDHAAPRDGGEGALYIVMRRQR